MHIMAAVALSELSSTTPVCTIPEKREISTQTENHGSDLWLSTAQTETIQLISKVMNSQFVSTTYGKNCTFFVRFMTLVLKLKK